MNRKILIAGAGQLGSRYLQGLAIHPDPLEIWVYDISSEALERASQRWKECGDNEHQVQFILTIEGIPREIDVAIIPSNSDVRSLLVSHISSISKVRYWILEKVLAQSLYEIEDIVRDTSGSEGVWVNTPMYLWPLYKNLRKSHLNSSPVHARITGVLGLICNAIHYIDLISRWNDCKVVSVDTSGLEPQWLPAKRLGFFETRGEILITYSDGSTLFLEGSEKAENYTVEIATCDGKWNVFESEGFAKCTDGRVIEGQVLFQSQQTVPMLEEIFQTGKCSLPTLEQSSHQHKEFLTAMIKHWNDNATDKRHRLPIT
jgi:hypothetical protein